MGHAVFLPHARDVRTSHCGPNPASVWCWRGTASGSSRCISRAAARICSSARNSRRCFAHPEIDRNLSLAGLDSYLSLNYAAGRIDVGGRHRKAARKGTGWSGARARPVANAIGGCPWAAKRTMLRAGLPQPRKRSSTGLLKLSVKEHLLADVPLGVWLSGGVDSSTLLHYAAEASGSRLKTFSISFHGRSFDESRLHPPGGRAIRHRP